MAYVTFLAFVVIFYSSNVFTARPVNETKKHKENGLDTLLDHVISEIPRKDTGTFFSQMFKNENIKKTIIPKSKKKHLTILPAKEELPTKKSTEARPDPDDNPAISVALTEPLVYLVNLKDEVESNKPGDYNAAKRFNIPQSGAKKPDYRTKRQNLLNEGFPILGSIPNNGVQTIPVETLNTMIPSQNNIGDTGVRSDTNGINSNKVMAVMPIKFETPMTVASPSSIAMVSQTPQDVQPTVLGTERSILPAGTTLIQTSPHLSTKSSNILRSSDVGNLLVRLGDQQNQLATTELQDSRLKLAPEQGNVIKLAQVPLNLLEQKTENSINEAKTGNLNENIKAKEETTAVKLNHLLTKPSNLEINDANKRNLGTKKDKSREDTETLKTLQSRLTKIISKLEEKMSRKKGELKQMKKEKSLSKIAKTKPSETSLKLLKQRLSHVLRKFNSKPGSGQPFTIGKEWVNVLSGTGARNGTEVKIAAGLKIQNENEGNWPSIASQLLKKLNKALIKLQEQKAARSLGKDAVMYFSFDNETASNEISVDDKSGHLNDGSVSGRAHSSSRTYGSCGKALILNSGSLHFDKYFKTKPTKAITLAMWVRTNATGYVKWFARDSGPSREFNTHTQYPLVHKNVWTHLCGTFNSSTGITRIYVDGELQAEKVNGQQETIPADFTPAGIGSEFGDESLIAVDEVYMFARALVPREVRILYDDCEFNRMVLHYGFQKINRSAGLVLDQSGLHNDAHLQGDARILDSGCDKCGSCLDLNGREDPRLTIQATHFKHIPTKAISIGAWFNLNTTSGTHPLFSVTESILHSPLLDLLVTDGKLQWKGYNKDHNAIFKMATTQAVVPEGIWVHILATFDSLQGQAKIFINGHQKAVTVIAKKVPIGEDWSEIKIGGNKSRSQASGGYMDEFVLYNWELEKSEILYIMKYCPDHPKLVSFTVHVPLD